MKPSVETGLASHSSIKHIMMGLKCILLRYLTYHDGAPKGIIVTLLNVFPESVNVKDKARVLKPSERLIRTFIAAHPNGAKSKDQD